MNNGSLVKSNPRTARLNDVMTEDPMTRAVSALKEVAAEVIKAANALQGSAVPSAHVHGGLAAKTPAPVTKLSLDYSKRITPECVVQHGKTHRPTRRRLPGRLADEITNWSGGVVSGTWNSAAGTWSIPAVSKPNEGAGADGGWDWSSWVGLDGSGSNDVLQAGVQQSVSASGKASYMAWYEWYCVFQKQTLSDTSPLSPALCSLNGRLYIAWRGDGNFNLNVMMSSDTGQTFGSKIISPETSDDAPALTTDGKSLFIAWKGHGNDNLNVATVSLDAATGKPLALVNKTVLGETSPVRPAIAALGTNLYLAWKGDGNDHINVRVSTDGGRTFGGKYTSGETSPQAPTIAAHNGALVLGWKGDGNDNLNVAHVVLSGVNPVGLANKVTLGDTSPVSPTLASFNGVLYLGWKGDGNDNINIMTSTNNGASFGGKYTSPETRPQPPVLVGHLNYVFVGWKGDGNDNLNVSLVGINKAGVIIGFSTPSYLYEVQIPNFPVAASDKVTCSVQYTNNGTSGEINFNNLTTAHNFQLTLSPPPGAQMLGNTSEWVMEVPTIDGAYSHLPSFTPVDFTGASCQGAGVTGNPQHGANFAILDDSGKALTSTQLGNDTVTISYV